MIRKMECAALYTANVEQSVDFYTAIGLKKSWIIERPLPDGGTWTIVGMSFPEEHSSELVLQNNKELKEIDIELLVDDVYDTYAKLKERSDIHWIREPFPTESGHVAVMEAPDHNVFVLVGK
ncbi:VOC family protein [Paenibacillus alvei]|uniref:VOC family protein n=1 Tax=Paenibacillus alvei TaxID=44250 RepID=A0ABT4GTD6_PAEAL|nr:MULTISPECIES: VOC family protein [Paenibacillus]MCY7483331.1 VOC family protein [Paenibacillus alvei]MCY9759959.1 VOC family protein [Paenibacillus alvei]MCY9768169.1 VOC family protein [Paenibacillus alvei]